MNHTTEQLYELITSSKSCSYFARTHVIKKPLSLMQLNALETERSQDLGYERASFRTSTMLARALHTFVFKPNSTILYVTNTLNSACDAQYVFRHMLESLPDYMVPPLKQMTRDTLVSEYGTRIQFRPATANVGRGLSLNMLLIDNYSQIKESLQEEMQYSLLPCLLATSSIMLKAQ
jgi:hypothetical protein